MRARVPRTSAGAGVVAVAAALLLVVLAVAPEMCMAKVDCPGVFLDLGSNVGDMIMKFAMKQPLVTVEERNPDVFVRDYEIIRRANHLTAADYCIFGFEPNPRHTEILRRTEEAVKPYVKSVQVFTETAAATHEGSIKLYVDTADCDPPKFCWGTSLSPDAGGVVKSKREETHMVKAMDFSRFLIDLAANYAMQSVIVKVDVEGAEYGLLARTITQGAWCRLTEAGANVVVILEFHRETYSERSERVHAGWVRKAGPHLLSKHCGIKMFAHFHGNVQPQELAAALHVPVDPPK